MWKRQSPLIVRIALFIFWPLPKMFGLTRYDNLIIIARKTGD
jgi:hypothetical protein